MPTPRLPDDGRPSSRRQPLPPAEAGRGPSVPPPLESTASHPRPALPGLVSETAEDNQPTVITTQRGRAGTDALAAGSLKGRQLGHFELLDPIGVGGMAAVLQARDLQLGRVVALKILPSEMAADPENIARFKQEARAAARLDHDNIARVYFCGEDQGLHFIAFEYVEGVNLRVLIEREGVLPAAEAVHYMLQVTQGLAHAAARGVVHRDIKPSNIIITPEGRAKIVDMGLARLDVPVSGAVTQSGVTLGTFDYISPEQALEPRSADVRSDIYSLGCTFYHAVTGQPPVPEGTAARKLHHHQHVAPLDPRQINPAVPDELAAVLARMMAKDPRQRFQRPEELVEALTRLARRLDLGTPSGVPTTRSASASPPLLVAALAAVLVAGLIVYLNGTAASDPGGETLPSHLLGQARPPATRPEAAPATPSTPGDVRPPEVGPKPPVPPADLRDVATADELVRALAGPVARVRLKSGMYDLTTRPDGLTFEGSELLIRAADPSDPPVVRFGPARGSPPADSPGPRAALTVVGPPAGKVLARVESVRFVLDAQLTDLPLRAVAARGRYDLRLSNCSFEFANLPAGSPVAAVTCRGWTPDDPPNEEGDSGARVENRHFLELAGCYFAGVAVPGAASPAGGAAVLAAGRVKVQARQCAFAPHRAIFQFEEPAATGHALPRAEVRLDHCTALLDRTTVFHFEGPADCQVKAGNSLFGQANPPGAETDAVLVRVNRRGSVRYEAEGGESGPKRNGYFGLSAFWSDEARPDRPERAVNLSDCTRLPGRPIAEDPGAELPVRPWQDSRPLAVLVRDPARAFRLDTAQSRLRVGGPASPLLGVRHCVNWPERDLSPTPLPPATDSGSLAQSVRVVDPSAAAGRQAGVYATVAAAVAEAQSGDVLLLKHNGDLRADPVDLKKERLALTIRPFPGYRPTLVLNEEAAREKLTALFRVFDGSLVLDGLQVSLRPQDSNRYAGLSLVAVVGGGSCEVRNCVVTLDAAGDFRPSVWALDNPEDVMKMMGAATSAPRLDLRNCLVRGKGHLLDVRSGRPFALSADNAVIALDGSLLSADLARKERPAGEADVRLERVTAHLTDYLLALRGADSRVGTVRLRCVASDCLFVPPAGGRSLVRVDGTDSEKAFQQLVGWQGQGNVYSDAIMQWVDLEGGADAMPAVPLGERDWVRLFGDADRERTVAAVRLQGLPADRPLTRARAEDFRPTYRAAGPDAEQPRAGATLDRIPSPAE